MQYLLDEEEYQRLRPDHRMPTRDGLVNVCQHIAETHVATVAVNGLLMPKGRPHRCIHVQHADPKDDPRYCDGCQIAGICPQPKNYSK